MRFYCLITVLCCMFFSAQTQSVDTLFIQAAKKKLYNAREYTLKVAALMPAENYQFKPSVDEMNFGEQLLHISKNLGWLSSSYLKGEQNPVRNVDTKLHQKDSIIAIVSRVYDYALNALEYFPADHLKDTVSFFSGPMNNLQIINLINDHQTHHRGQLIVYLRMNGIKPPGYVGW
jgi:uncharacterized damage-inducible protein DinB